MLFQKEATMFNCSRNVAVSWLQISPGPNLLQPINFSRLTVPLVHTYVVHTNRLINFVFDCISLLMRLFVCIFYSKLYIPCTIRFYRSPRGCEGPQALKYSPWEFAEFTTSTLFFRQCTLFLCLVGLYRTDIHCCCV